VRGLDEERVEPNGRTQVEREAAHARQDPGAGSASASSPTGPDDPPRVANPPRRTENRATASPPTPCRLMGMFE
jgi:hypothetical protein